MPVEAVAPLNLDNGVEDSQLDSGPSDMSSENELIGGKWLELVFLGVPIDAKETALMRDSYQLMYRIWKVVAADSNGSACDWDSSARPLATATIWDTT
ncbi:hypothetical protein D9619_008664 [Psilocybe cf. subviscida]|uniref:Uncharacterized protein n=1 Tax=Psilocybe cf. subviscida TaxID=2480587 RepID=A0A8H5BAD8_9AGAR|nr:hypothetical protein D9619_008664 [Psilocybe cf. subviscida]